MAIPFSKQHGLGNDFVVMDARRTPLALTMAGARAIADRRRGVGCDQVIVIEPPPEDTGGIDAFMRVFNADGGEVSTCGNATRCVAAVLMAELARDRVTLATRAATLRCRAAPGGLVEVDMGPAHLDWTEIPLAAPLDTLHLPLAVDGLGDAVAVGLGNPHTVFFVADVGAVPLDVVGPKVEHDPLFPERTNVEIVEVRDPGTIRMRVWERGVGITQASGSGACAAAVAAMRRALTARKIDVILDGGTLTIAWNDDGHVLMTGPAHLSFTGEIPEAMVRVP